MIIYLFNNISRLVIVFALAFFASTSFLHAQNTKVIVAGVKSEIDEPEWNNQLISQGLTHILEQELANSEQCIIIETNPEILEAVNRRDDRQTNIHELESVEPISAQHDFVDAYAYAVVKDFSVSRNRIQIGPFCSGDTSVEVQIQVCFVQSKANYCRALGIGQGKTKSLGAFFHIQNDKVYFDATTVGQAAKEAVQDAVKKLQSSCNAFSHAGS